MPRTTTARRLCTVAASKGHKDVAELLLANKAEVNAKDNDGATPLHWAAHNGHKDVAELLLANKAEVNAKDNDGETPLHWAAAKGHKDVVELLLANGADANVKAKNGATPRSYATEKGYKEVVELLSRQEFSRQRLFHHGRRLFDFQLSRRQSRGQSACGHNRRDQMTPRWCRWMRPMIWRC